MIKYPSLINHYRENEIEKFKSMFDIDSCYWIATEKLHGSNISIRANTNGTFQWFSRKQEITGQNFYKAEYIFEEFVEIYGDHLMEMAQTHNEPITLFGELFGSNIQKGIDYGPEKRISIFDCYIGETLISPYELIRLPFRLVPIVKFGTFDELINMDTNFNSLAWKNEGDNTCEGIVIKPYDKVFTTAQGSVFYIKKKNEKFKEKQKTKKEKVIDNVVEKWQNEFNAYLNEERLESVYSKYGRIEDEKQIGQYIKYVIEDAKETFLQEESEFPINELDKKQIKQIFNQGKEVYKLICKVV